MDFINSLTSKTSREVNLNFIAFSCCCMFIATENKKGRTRTFHIFRFI